MTLLSKANEAIEQHYDNPMECNISVLTDLRRQLQRKDGIISNLNSEIVKLIEDEDDLVSDVCEVEETQECLMTIIAQLSLLLETRPCPPDP